jgi:hypothetical protein
MKSVVYGEVGVKTGRSPSDPVTPPLSINPKAKKTVWQGLRLPTEVCNSYNLNVIDFQVKWTRTRTEGRKNPQ